MDRLVTIKCSMAVCLERSALKAERTAKAEKIADVAPTTDGIRMKIDSLASPFRKNAKTPPADNASIEMTMG